MLLRALAHEVKQSLVDFLFPPICPVCGGTFPEGDAVCPACREAVMRAAFRYTPPPRSLDKVDHISVLLPYDTHCRKLIHSLKYHCMPSVGLFLGKLIGQKAQRDKSLPENALVVPVPLHPSRRRERGYNQSERLASGFASFSGHAIAENIIERSRHTPSQTALDSETRIKNVHGAFRYTDKTPLNNRPVIIIDDVLTTGSTVSECARTLRECGAGTVTVCVAATPDIGDD